MKVAVAAAALLAFAACDAADEAPPVPVDVDLPAVCDTAPILTWYTFGEGFLVSRCQTCHASTAPDRRGAPAAFAFDRVADVRAHKDRIRARVLADTTMPPGGGLLAEETSDLDLWLQCDPCLQVDAPGCPE